MTISIPPRIPQVGDSYWKHGRVFARVKALDCYGRVWVLFFGYTDQSRYTVEEFQALIERETWGRP